MQPNISQDCTTLFYLILNIKLKDLANNRRKLVWRFPREVFFRFVAILLALNG